jgi:hypothetical protein
MCNGCAIDAQSMSYRCAIFRAVASRSLRNRYATARQLTRKYFSITALSLCKLNVFVSLQNYAQKYFHTCTAAIGLITSAFTIPAIIPATTRFDFFLWADDRPR